MDVNVHISTSILDISQAVTANHVVRMIGVTGRYVTEDFSRKVRKHREELIKFAKSLRNVEPDARSSNKFSLYCLHKVTAVKRLSFLVGCQIFI